MIRKKILQFPTPLSREDVRTQDISERAEKLQDIGHLLIAVYHFEGKTQNTL